MVLAVFGLFCDGLAISSLRLVLDIFGTILPYKTHKISNFGIYFNLNTFFRSTKIFTKKIQI